MVHCSPPSNRNEDDNDLSNGPFLHQINSSATVKGTLDFDATREKLKQLIAQHVKFGFEFKNLRKLTLKSTPYEIRVRLIFFKITNIFRRFQKPLECLHPLVPP